MTEPEAVSLEFLSRQLYEALTKIVMRLDGAVTGFATELRESVRALNHAGQREITD